MLYNKNNVRKTNDKKILHKVGKQWKVVSVALLMALGGGAAVAATHTNANAATADDNNDAQVNSMAASLEAPQSANNAFANYSAQSSSVAPSASSAVNYYGGASGSAASYFARVNSDNDVASAKKGIVNKYVQSLNAVYTPQVNSFNAKYNSLNDETKKDNKLANSYSATNANPNTAKTVASLAAKHNINDPAMYQQFVEGTENMYSGEVSSASNDVKAASDVQSLVSRFETTNMNSAASSASANSEVANSASVSASATVQSLSNEFNGNSGFGKWVSDANSLMVAGSALGNNANVMASTFYNMALSSAETSYGANPTNRIALDVFASSAMTSTLNSAVSVATSEDKSDFSSNYVKSGAIKLGSYTFPSNSSNVRNIIVSASANNMGIYYNGASDNSNFDNAVSAEVNFKMGQYIYAQATSLLGEYQASNAAYENRTKEANSLLTSAKATSAATSNLSLFASANDSLVDSVSNDVADHVTSASDANNVDTFSNATDAAAFVANSYLAEGIDNFAFDGNNVILNSDSSANSSAVASADKLVSSASASYEAANDALVQLSDYNVNAKANKKPLSNSTAASESANNAKVAFNNDKVLLSVENSASNFANSEAKNEFNADYGTILGALLSDGVDLDQLSAESNAISDVASAAASAMSSSNSETSHMSYGTQFANALSIAASSADTNLANAKNSLSAYNSDNGTDVTLASYFATSYSSDASSASDAASSAFSTMDSFYQSAASDEVFTSADNAYQTALTEAANDKKMGVANAKDVFNTSAHFLDVLKNAKLHTSTNYGSKGDKVVGMANKGDRLTVEGVNFNYRGATRYYVLDNTTGKKGFFTGQLNFSKPAYLNATYKDANISVKTLKPVNVYNAGKKVVTSIPANQVVNNVTVVSANNNDDAMGFTKVETKEGNFFTANTDFVEVSQPVQNNTPVAPSNQPSNTKLDPFYNNDSQL